MKVASVGTSMALHAMGAKQEAVNTFPTYYAWRNWIRFFIKYTPEEKLVDMAITFLGSVFQQSYIGMYKDENRVAQTVMLAYDDAIHGVTGKAGADRIFPVDINLDKLQELFESADAFYIETGAFPILAERIRQLAVESGVDVTWLSELPEESRKRAPGQEQMQCAEAAMGAAAVPTNYKVISLCEDIFQVKDLSLDKIYVDIERCVLRTEEDAQCVRNYMACKQSFIYANLPVFMECVRTMRQEAQ